MTCSKIVGGVEHGLEKLGEKSLALLSNSKYTVVEEEQSPGYWGKLVVRKGDNPARG